MALPFECQECIVSLQSQAIACQSTERDSFVCRVIQVLLGLLDFLVRAGRGILRDGGWA